MRSLIIFCTTSFAIAKNNWWLAHEDCTSTPNDILNCKCKDGSKKSSGTISFSGTGSHGWVSVFNDKDLEEIDSLKLNSTIQQLQPSREKEYDNEIFFELLQNFTFVEMDHLVSSGQPYDGVTLESFKGNTATLDVKAGRNPTDEVAAWFNANLLRANMAATEEFGLVSDAMPSKLSFAVKLDVSFTVQDSSTTCTFHEMRVAQGHYGL